MPPSIPGAKHLPVHPATVFESTAQKWSRLSPWAQLPCWAEQRASRYQWGYSWSYRYRPYTRRSWPDEAWASDSTSDHRHTAATTTWADNRITTSARPRADAPGQIPVTAYDQHPYGCRITSRSIVAADLQELPSAREGSGSSARSPPRTVERRRGRPFGLDVHVYPSPRPQRW